jgi:hypothetical protein
MTIATNNNAHGHMPQLTWICSAPNLSVTAVNEKEAS